MNNDKNNTVETNTLKIKKYTSRKHQSVYSRNRTIFFTIGSLVYIKRTLDKISLSKGLYNLNEL